MSAATLVLMAAGLGSRFRGGIKQLAKVSPDGALLMDYSIYDALQAGFSRVVFVIRREIEADFKQTIGNRIEKALSARQVEVHYAFQELDDLPAGFRVPEGRTKPFGTGQAVLAAKDLIREPFIVINADDYYGKEGFRRIHEALTSENGEHCMAGFVLKNTLSDNGGVTRGICHMKDHYLTRIKETKNIRKTPEGAEADGTAIDIDAPVSMNMWGFWPEYLQQLEQGFRDFFRKEVPENPLKAEFLIPIHVGDLLEADGISVKVLPTDDTWYGMTYKEDVPEVRKSFAKLIQGGIYTEELFDDLA